MKWVEGDTVKRVVYSTQLPKQSKSSLHVPQYIIPVYQISLEEYLFSPETDYAAKLSKYYKIYRN